ncbi:sugar kinase [Candidatus Poribacteria bacterium]|nr:sugar kinase [Candidatus Poribacteria bacterium]
MSILVVGSVALDSVETPHGSVDAALGGSATFFSVAASYFAPVRLVAVVGTDFAEEHVAFLRSRGVDLEGLERREGKTFHWKGRYTGDMNEATTLATDLNVYAEFDPKLPAAYRDSDYVFLANIAPDLQYRVLDQATRPRLVTADTMNLWINTAKADLLRTLQRVDILVINDGEARLLSGEANLIKASRAILRMGPSRVVVKKGSHGAISLTADSYCVTPAYPLEEVADPTGAGDTFAGGFVGYVASAGAADERAIRNAMLFGTALASFDVEDFSLNRQRALTRAEIDRRVEELREFVSTD